MASSDCILGEIANNVFGHLLYFCLLCLEQMCMHVKGAVSDFSDHFHRFNHASSLQKSAVCRGTETGVIPQDIYFSDIVLCYLFSFHVNAQIQFR